MTNVKPGWRPRDDTCYSSVRPNGINGVQHQDGLQEPEGRGGVEQGIEEREEVQLDGEARKAAVMRRPYTPTQKDVEEHMVLHIPYRP